MRRALPLALLCACGGGGDDTVFSTVQPAYHWVDATGVDVTSGPELEYVDERGVAWPLDWRTGQVTAVAYPGKIYATSDCTGQDYVPAVVPPLHPLQKGEDDYVMPKPSARMQMVDDAFTDVGPGCTPAGDDVIAYL